MATLAAPDTIALASEIPSPTLAGLDLGIALAGGPGPVQAVLLSDALRVIGYAASRPPGRPEDHAEVAR